MNTYKPEKGIAVVNNPNLQGLVCQCGNTDESKIVDHVEIISRGKDIHGQWFEKSKDFLKCQICGEIEPLEEAFVQARESVMASRIKRVETLKTKEANKAFNPGGLSDGLKVTDDEVIETVNEGEAAEVVDADLDEISTMPDGSLEVGASSKKYKKKRKYTRKKKK